MARLLNLRANNLYMMRAAQDAPELVSQNLAKIGASCKREMLRAPLAWAHFQKSTAALRMLAWGVARWVLQTSGWKHRALMSEARCWACVWLGRFSRGSTWGSPHARTSWSSWKNNTQRGFAGMFASLGCMHYRWKNWEAQFQDRRHEPLNHFWGRSRSIALDLACLLQATGLEGRFERPWADLPLVAKLLKGEAAEINYGLNGKTYLQYYVLTNGTYPKMADIRADYTWIAWIPGFESRTFCKEATVGNEGRTDGLSCSSGSASSHSKSMPEMESEHNEGHLSSLCHST